MTIFILISIAMMAIALLIITLPLRNKNNGHNKVNTRKQQNILFAQSRLKELNQQLNSNTISSSEFNELKNEIEKNLALDLNLVSPENNKNEPGITNGDDEINNSNGILLSLLCTLIPFIGLIFYLLTGTPSAINQQSDHVNNQFSVDSQTDGKNINQMVSALEKRLKENPSDIEGWIILARTYTALGQYQNSINASLSLHAAGGESANSNTQLADASALLAQGNLAGQPTSYIKRALELDPLHPQALWLAGLSYAQQGQSLQAIEQWNILLPLLIDTPEQQEELRAIIQQTESESQQNYTPIADSKQNVKSKQQSPNTNGGISVSVSIKPELISMIKRTDTVFIFAKAKNGPPAPLAVKRAQVQDLPITVVLSDEDAMIDQLKLSLFKDVIVSARISRSGNPISQPGDFESMAIETSVTKNGANNNNTINLEIFKLVN